MDNRLSTLASVKSFCASVVSRDKYLEMTIFWKITKLKMVVIS